MGAVERNVMRLASVGTVIEKLFTAFSGARREKMEPVNAEAAPKRPTSRSVHIGSCSPSETIVVKTGSSVYEVVVLRADCGEVLVRGGTHFRTFCPALFVGSIRNDGAVERHTIDIGLRMKFYFERLVITTSAVQSLSTDLANAATTECVATRSNQTATALDALRRSAQEATS
jgi:hypothetical protein